MNEVQSLREVIAKLDELNIELEKNFEKYEFIADKTTFNIDKIEEVSDSFTEMQIKNTQILEEVLTFKSKIESDIKSIGDVVANTIDVMSADSLEKKIVNAFEELEDKHVRIIIQEITNTSELLESTAVKLNKPVLELADTMSNAKSNLTSFTKLIKKINYFYVAIAFSAGLFLGSSLMLFKAFDVSQLMLNNEKIEAVQELKETTIKLNEKVNSLEGLAAFLVENEISCEYGLFANKNNTSTEVPYLKFKLSNIKKGKNFNFIRNKKKFIGFK